MSETKKNGNAKPGSEAALVEAFLSRGVIRKKGEDRRGTKREFMDAFLSRGVMGKRRRDDKSGTT